MKRNEVIRRSLLTLCLCVSLVTASAPVCYGAPETGQDSGSEQSAKKASGTEESPGTDQEENGVQDESRIEIRDVEDFQEFVRNCKYDSWSLGRTVSLVSDLDLSGLDFDGIAYFNGVFEGNGHEIAHVRLEPKGSDYGFFRYVGENGCVKDLNISGSVVPSGSQENIGGIAGVNDGTIENCSFRGTVNGIKSVGGIAGKNRSSGKLVSCASEALVLATNFTGGIAGTNEGMITGCVNKSSVNTEELEPTLDLGGVDLGSFNFAQNVVNRNDMGGIAGTSHGLIVDCTNEGIVGYRHTGYNAGGIAGSQNGTILTSVNKGKVYGRKDVGGIVGQAEPYVESEYLDDKVRQTKEDIDRLSRTMNHISATMSATSSQVRQQAENLDQQYTMSVENISGSIKDLAAAAQGDPEAQQYVDQINAAVDNIHSIQSAGGELSQEQMDAIQNNLDTINNNLGSLQGTYDDAGQSAEEFADGIADQIQQSRDQKASRDEEIRKMADTIDAGVQSIANSMESASNQIAGITNSIGNDLALITGEEEIVEDISSVETAESMDGVVSGCVNYGEINGDLNAGGIAGTMNIEYDGDPEFDLKLRNDVNVRLRSTVNGVIIHSVNHGAVTVKKNCAGGITGLQELGFIYDCEGYGAVQSDTGNYLGGIVGDSAGTVEKSYTLCNLSGMDYVGGICGSGYSVKDNISVSNVGSSGERIGSIAGYLAEEGTVKGNVFVSDDVHGVDNISYAGTADQSSYEEVMEMEGIPEGFSRVTIFFESEEDIIAEKQIAYGGSLTKDDFPDVPEKEGHYVEWPGLKDLTDIRENLTVEAEYVPWTESVAGSEKTEDGKRVFLAVGAFYEDTKVRMTAIDGPAPIGDEAAVAYAYSWELISGREKSFETVEAHLAIPTGAESVSVWVEGDGAWNEIQAKTDGSYLVAELPYGADFAVVTQPAEDNRYWVIAGAAAAVLAGVVLIWYSKKTRKKGDAARKKK